jgi:glutamate decarboxylase
MPLHDRVSDEHRDAQLTPRPQYALTDGNLVEVPRFRLPDQSMAPDAAAQLIRDDLLLDGNARLNLATFVTTWMEPHAAVLMAESADKNMIDKDEYPLTAEIESRCVNILADLWHADEGQGCSTVGSSEACMLGGLAFLFRWRKRATAPGARPNLVMGANVQVVWEKFCRYWDVEPRLAPLAPGRTHLTAETALALCDENTIGVVAILGSTFDGAYEPVKEIADALDKLQADKGIDIPLHVDGASGGFVAPFIDPDLEWDFRIPRVASINASGHKFGLVYPGVGWVVWRDASAIPEELVFNVDYLGGNMPTYTLNFSRPGAQVIGQYYCFLRLGREGYTRVQQVCRDNTRWLADRVAAMDEFELVSDGRTGIPAFAFKIADDVEGYTVFDVSERLRSHGWQVPAYHFPPDLQDLATLRVVVRNGFSRELAEALVDHLGKAAHDLRHGHGGGERHRDAFHH